MKCKVCGAESGKYPLCRGCNLRKEKGEVIKCAMCGEWHLLDASCVAPPNVFVSVGDKYLYDAKKHLLAKQSKAFLRPLKHLCRRGIVFFLK